MGTQVIGFQSPGLKDSLLHYSKQNLLIERNYLRMSEVINTIIKANMIKINIKPGWGMLHREVIKYIDDI
jgi:hypothetical protein